MKKVLDEEKHLAFRKMTERIFQIYFSFFGIIDAQERKLSIIDTNTEYKDFDKNEIHDYDKFVRGELVRFIPEEEKKDFIECASLEYIQQQLKKHAKYDFTVNQYKKNHEVGIFVYHLAQLDEKKIMCIVEEITERVDMDEITKEISFPGFLRKTEGYLHNLKTEYSIVHFDIQGFKAINEQVGFVNGNNILREVTRALKESKLKPLLVSRSMGDHYYCLINREDLDYDEISRLCQQKIAYGQSHRKVTMVCGIYHIEDRSIKVRAMCDKARLAGDQLKRSDMSNTYFVFTEEMKEVYLEQQGILSKLDAAIASEEFEAYYQPIFDARTERLVSAEALVRWITKEGKIISPGFFIPVLEENGQISKIDLLVVKQVKRFLEERSAAGGRIVPISLNLSRNDLYNEEIISKLLQRIEKLQVDPSYLRFEITESAYVDIPDIGEAMIQKMRQYGSQILIDDFGSGYSSLGTLADRYFHIVKLDMVFTRRIGKSRRAEAIIASAIDMAHLLDAKVVAEGVETKEQLDFLRSVGCDYIQGFYFSKPLEKKEFEKLLDESDYL